GAAAHRALKVLFVCTANICRSPYMEIRARNLSVESTTITFASAGTHGFNAYPMDSTMAQVLTSRGAEETQSAAFTSRRLTRELIEDADLVLTAEASHRAFVLEEVPRAFRKAFTLGQFAESMERTDPSLTGAELVAAVGHRRAGNVPDHDIRDPFRRGQSAARTSADQIDAWLQRVLPRLAALTDQR
ncbi:MAG: adenylyl-sulfate kinase, partial [Nocardioidaceae bacterium]|nr:adenylyl-sulfate kinase [Nocardioidaceae bacterium]